MQELWQHLASPRHLMVFEAAARHGSFTQAARELNVQQPAVSAAIKQLENSLGVALFARHHRRVVLTSSGTRLFQDVSAAFDTLLTAARTLRPTTRPGHVTLNASSAFNFYWMTPRLADFQELHPGVDLRLQISDREPDIDAENISLAVRRGDGNWPGCDATLIAPEVIFPVAAPRVMAAATALKSLPDLLQQRLIHLEEPIRARPTWQQWFAHFNVHTPLAPQGLRLNDYALVLQAAMAGQGFAFGWQHVTAPLIANGMLAARKDWCWRTGQGFYLVWSRSQPLSPAAIIARDWIIAQSSQDSDG